MEAECALALGGVATVPLRIPAAEQVLAGATLDDTTIRTAARACADGASPLPETGYKVDLVVATVIETLERLRDDLESNDASSVEQGMPGGQ